MTLHATTSEIGTTTAGSTTAGTPLFAAYHAPGFAAIQFGKLKTCADWGSGGDTKEKEFGVANLL